MVISLHYTLQVKLAVFFISSHPSVNYFNSIPLKRIQYVNLFYKMRKYVLNFSICHKSEYDFLLFRFRLVCFQFFGKQNSSFQTKVAPGSFKDFKGNRVTRALKENFYNLNSAGNFHWRKKVFHF